ncbi:hypothetical protein FP744_10000019 [Trichoderma asperellum]
MDIDDDRYNYVVNIQSSAGILVTHLRAIEEDDKTESFKSQLRQLADCLEEIFSTRVISISGLNVSEHPRLHAILKIASKSDDWKSNSRDFFDTSTWKDLDSWDKLHGSLKSLTDELLLYGDNMDEVEESKFPKAPQEPIEEMHNFINRALDAVLCRSHNKSERELMLLVGTYKKRKSRPEPKCLCILVAQDKSFLKWHELLVHDQTRRLPNTKLTEIRTSHTEYYHPDVSNHTPCMCSYLKVHTRPYLRLNIDLHDHILHLSNLPPVKCEFESGLPYEQINLMRLLSSEDKQWTELSKWTLAVILAYSLLYLYTSPSARAQWRRENIIFFRHGARIPLQPLFRTSQPQQRERKADDVLRFHNYPEILELGVILLEIYLGKRLQFFLNDDYIKSYNDFYLSAWEVYVKQQNQIISLAYRNAIESCLAPATFNMAESDNLQLRSLLFQRVVRPLEEELMRNFQEQLDFDDLDKEAAEKCNLTLSMAASNYQSADSGRNVQHLPVVPEPPLQYPAQEGRKADVRAPGNLLEAQLGAEITSSERRHGKMVSSTTMLSDARKHVGDKEMISDWTEWLNDFKSFREQILPEAVDPENQQRVRVTVIDTGIDASHPYIQSKRWTSEDKNATELLFCDFVKLDSDPDKHKPIDADGHGTFISGLLLQMAPDIELSVARIGVTRKLMQDDAQVGDKIARAIKHAINTWHTDIISMSFGSEDMSCDIRDAIDEAIKRNVILLAAAGNSGNRKHIPYPASEEGVFKIFAANTSGYATEFSPPASDSDSKYSYFTLGFGVVSTWPLSLQKEAAADELYTFCRNARDEHEHSEDGCDVWTVLSGTSFATPIAAALVAIIYQFYDANEPLKSRVKLREGSTGRFKTSKAVRAILDKMSRTSPRAPYNFLEPARGRDDYFYFRPGPGNVSGQNMDGQTPIEFFSKKLSDVLYSANI